MVSASQHCGQHLPGAWHLLSIPRSFWELQSLVLHGKPGQGIPKTHPVLTSERKHDNLYLSRSWSVPPEQVLQILPQGARSVGPRLAPGSQTHTSSGVQDSRTQEELSPKVLQMKEGGGLLPAPSQGTPATFAVWEEGDRAWAHLQP